MSNSIAGVWVKASERLPDKADRYFIYCRPLSMKRVATFNGKNFDHEFTNKDFEWLDEQPIPVNQDDYWQKRCEAAEKNLQTYSDWMESSFDHSDPAETEKNYNLWQDALKAWQQLKSSPSPTPQKEYTDKELNDFACDVSLSTIFPESAQERSKEELGNWKERLEVEVLQEIGDYGLTGGECIMIERWIEENLLIKSNSTPVQEGLREDEKWKKNTFEDNDGH